MEESQSQHREAQEAAWRSSQTKNLILVTAPFIFIITDEEGRIKTVNPAIRDIFGYFEGDVEGKGLSEIIPELRTLDYDYFTHVSARGELEMFNTEFEFNLTDDELEQEQKNITEYNYLERFIYGHISSGKKGEIKTKRKNGSLIWIDLSVNRVHIGDQQVFTVLINDITSSKQRESEIIQLNELLEQRVIERTRQLEESNEELRRTLQELKETQEALVESKKMAALGDLVAGVAHEINTPIGVGVTAASHLQDECNNIDRLYKSQKMRRGDFEDYINTSRETSGMILSNLIRAGELVKSFKMIAVDQATEEKRTFHLKRYILDVITSLHPKLKQTNISFVVECPDDLEMDSYPGAISQVFTNLILNSVIHGYEFQEKGSVTIQVTTNDAMVVLVYKDDGKGISPENVSRIFEPFFTTKRHSGGTGLGMHIIYNIVRHRLKGQINCKSTLGAGATFTVTLPRIS